MTIQVLHKTDIGTGLQVTDNKLVTDNFIKDINVTGGKVVATFLDDTIVERALPEQVVDVKLQNAVVEGELLKLTLTNGEKIGVSLASLIPPAKNAEQLWNELKAVPDFKTSLINFIKGEEVHSFANELKGYLLATA